MFYTLAKAVLSSVLGLLSKNFVQEIINDVKRKHAKREAVKNAKAQHSKRASRGKRDSVAGNSPEAPQRKFPRAVQVTVAFRRESGAPVTAQTVTCSFETTAFYWISPNAAIAETTDVQLGSIAHGSVYGSPESPATLTLSLDDTFTWNIAVTMQGVEPIVFPGLNVTGGGDLITLLTAQGWTP